MPAHDWTRVSAGTFHDFHHAWTASLRNALNGGVLPKDFYAKSEQMAGEIVPDVLTLHHETNRPFEGNGHAAEVIAEGAVAVAVAPPKVAIVETADAATIYAMRRRTVIIRHASNDAIVAMIEIISPGNKDRVETLDKFLDKAGAALNRGIHLLLIDLFPPGSVDPNGIHGALWPLFASTSYRQPEAKPLTLAAYDAKQPPVAYVQPLAVGDELADMPLFLTPEEYVNVPLERTYQEAYAGVPRRWREVIEGAAS